MPEIEKIKIGSRKCPFNIVKLQGNFRVLLKMASDSEGLRRNLHINRAERNKVENGFRFGRVTTYLPVLISPHPLFVENGFRFGRVTTWNTDYFNFRR